MVVHTPKSRQITRESSQGLPNYPWTREGFKLPETRKELEKLSQVIQKVIPPLTNLMLSHPKIGKYFSEVVLSRAMESDTYARARKYSTRVEEETISQIGAHLSQVCICTFFIEDKFFVINNQVQILKQSTINENYT